MIYRIIPILAFLASFPPLLAADKGHSSSDPLAGAFFPPELVLLARDRISLTPEQLEAARAQAEKVQPRSDELRARMESDTAALGAIAKKEHVDEAALHKQLDKVLDLEREAKHLHLGLAAAMKNLLTPEQQTKLREIAANGMQQLDEDAKKRLTEKVERVKEGAEKWASSGRDPSEIFKSMEGKFKPLMEAGKAIEAEAELDKILSQIASESK